MNEQSPVVVLVHGAFAESASWNGVVERLSAQSIETVAAANPLRSLASDAAYLRTGSTLGQALDAYPVSTSGNDLRIKPDLFHHQFCADVPADQAAVMAATQRPATDVALTGNLPTASPAWKTIPSWFVFSDQDLNIPVALHRFMAERAGAKDTREVAGASHALSVSAPEPVTAAILDALSA